jgi:hypothetical protein
LLFGDSETNALSEEIIRCAIEVHRELGPGVLESIYETALCIELKSAGMAVMLTYLRITGLHAGLLLNFNTPFLKQGIKSLRLVITKASERRSLPFEHSSAPP